VGIILSLVGIVVQIGIPTESNCMVREVIPSMSLSLILANISVKTWRIWKIFDNKALKRVQIQDFQLVGMTASLLAFEAIIFIAWAATDPPKPYVNFGDWICFSPLGKNYDFALKGYKILLIIGNAFLAYSVRTVKLNQFNESLHIAFSIYNILVVFVLVTILELNINKLKPTFIISSCGTLIIMVGILATLFAPKLWMIAVSKIPALQDQGLRKGSLHDSISGGASHHQTKLVTGKSHGLSSDLFGDHSDESSSVSGSSTLALNEMGKGRGNGASATSAGGGAGKHAVAQTTDDRFDWT